MTDHSFTIKPYHWWLTLSVAIILHAFLLINYKQENTHIQESADTEKNEIIIGLKKLKPPPSIEKPAVIEVATKSIIPPVEPVKPKPIIKKQSVPKPKPKPVITINPAVIKSVATPPQVNLISTNRAQNNSASKQSETKTTHGNEASHSATTENERDHYQLRLAQWLERHKKYPTIARRRNQQGTVTIQFVIDSEGELLRYQLIEGCEYESLNEATVNMLKRASPMPAPPKELIGDKAELTYTIPVQFNLVK